MFDKYMICEDGFRNVGAGDGGEPTGFQLQLRLPYYRGLGLSMVEDVAVSVDGEPVPRDDIRLRLRDKSWSIDELENEFEERWEFGEKATVEVRKPGGLAPGKHRVEAMEKLRISYLPWVPEHRAQKELTLGG